MKSDARWFLIPLLLLASIPGSMATQETGDRVAALVLEGSISEAASLAHRTPESIPMALDKIQQAVDRQMSDQDLTQASATLQGAHQFVADYEKSSGAKLSADGLAARQLRLEGIRLLDAEEQDSSLTKLQQALELSRSLQDPALEARVLNNIGQANLQLRKFGDAAEHFAKAREISEGRNEDASAAIYNFNLGLAFFEQRRWDEALEAFRRSETQGERASESDTMARSVYWQGRVHFQMKPIGKEAMKYFRRAEKMFTDLGDQRNLGLCFRLMGEHMAYSLDFTQATLLAEKAIDPFTAAGEKGYLKECYSFLADMSSRAGQIQKSEEYKKKAAAITSPR